MALKECFDRIEETTVETTEETTREITKETITYYNTWLIISIVIMKCSDDSPLHFQELPDKQGNKTPILEPCVAQQSPDSAHPSPAQVTDPASGHHM